ncbi:hypothetical protein BCR33DRAFT_721628 [Rhizoclosmatium globosum]|uniref:Uncharacterized protein n=1 Tax=Rhizoclosmatium globosum TaxID=329046 RepID=A0A1Y2BRL8_9FUNG|nr:hypothetical protein BCR33DRAFT_721628 [Rhizoclosmatium globosum]|eukprot:ORY37277.1 hypothetical protein BCR33DRAFT_721628 [Rhizoclosmatium globosum]
MSLHFDDAVATSTGVFIVIAMNCLSSFGVNVQAAALRERRPVLAQDEDPLLSLEDSQAQTQAQSQPPKVFPFLPLAVRPWLWLIGWFEGV